MSKILSIDNDIITIGMDGGTHKEVIAVDLNFVPHVNDEVEIFETETKTIVSKLEKEQPNPLPYSPNGININVQNTQEMKNEQSSTLANGTIAVNKVVYCLLAFSLVQLAVTNSIVIDGCRRVLSAFLLDGYSSNYCSY